MVCKEWILNIQGEEAKQVEEVYHANSNGNGLVGIGCDKEGLYLFIGTFEPLQKEVQMCKQYLNSDNVSFFSGKYTTVDSEVKIKGNIQRPGKPISNFEMQGEKLKDVYYTLNDDPTENEPLQNRFENIKQSELSGPLKSPSSQSRQGSIKPSSVEEFPVNKWIYPQSSKKESMMRDTGEFQDFKDSEHRNKREFSFSSNQEIQNQLNQRLKPPTSTQEGRDALSNDFNLSDAAQKIKVTPPPQSSQTGMKSAGQTRSSKQEGLFHLYNTKSAPVPSYDIDLFTDYELSHDDDSSNEKLDDVQLIERIASTAQKYNKRMNPKQVNIFLKNLNSKANLTYFFERMSRYFTDFDVQSVVQVMSMTKHDSALMADTVLNMKELIAQFSILDQDKILHYFQTDPQQLQRIKKGLGR